MIDTYYEKLKAENDFIKLNSRKGINPDVGPNGEPLLSSIQKI